MRPRHWVVGGLWFLGSLKSDAHRLNWSHARSYRFQSSLYNWETSQFNHEANKNSDGHPGARPKGLPVESTTYATATCSSFAKTLEFSSLRGLPVGKPFDANLLGPLKVRVQVRQEQSSQLEKGHRRVGCLRVRFGPLVSLGAWSERTSGSHWCVRVLHVLLGMNISRRFCNSTCQEVPRAFPEAQRVQDCHAADGMYFFPECVAKGSRL